MNPGDGVRGSFYRIPTAETMEMRIRYENNG
jgi:hypothetical protein